MVAASRKEQPPFVDVRYAVRAELESLLRTGKISTVLELGWLDALFKLFRPGFVKLGVAAAFVGMLALALTISTTSTDVEMESEYNDPLITLYSGEGKWFDWL